MTRSVDRITRRIFGRSTELCSNPGGPHGWYRFGSVRRRRLFAVLRDLPLRHRLHRQSAGAQDHRQRRRRPADPRAGDQHPAARPVRHPAQRHGAAGLQALVDALRAACRRTHDLRAAGEPGAGPAVLAVAADPGAGLDGDQPGRQSSPSRSCSGWAWPGAAQHLPAQPLRAVRPAPGLGAAARPRTCRRRSSARRSSTSACAIRSISASCSPSGRRRS